MPLRLMMWNVQHGSAAYIQTPNGKHIVIDLGAGDDFSPLKHLWECGMRKLDHVTITHPHMDHIEDILYFDTFAPTSLWAPLHLTEDDIRSGNRQPSQEAEAKIQKYLEITGGVGSVDPQNDVTKPENNGNVSVKTFIPSQASTSNLNDHSVVTILEYSGVKILIPGDNESLSWEELLEATVDLATAIAGTRRTGGVASRARTLGFIDPLFDHFQPLITLISDGRAVKDTSATNQIFSERHERVGSQQARMTSGRDRTASASPLGTMGTIEVEVGINTAGQRTVDTTLDVTIKSAERRIAAKCADQARNRISPFGRWVPRNIVSSRSHLASQ